MSRRKYSAFLPIVLFVFFAQDSIAAQPMLEWEESPQFETEVNGKPDIGIRSFQPSSSKPYLLLVRDKGRTGVLLDLAGKKVKEIPASDLKTNGQFGVSTKGIPVGKDVASYKVNAGASVFTFEGKQYAVRMRETLIGEVSLGMLLAHSPLYSALRDAYTPKKASVAAIAKHKQATEIVVMFATWCSTCKIVVPRFLKVMQLAKNPSIKVRYIGIAMGGGEPRAELEKFGHDYPAFIVFQGGKEKGRLVGEPPSRVEEYLLTLLKK